ncbi:MAG: CDP-alcohol phosphatidyltransferase family protein [Anaerolineae bacterium]
MKHDSYSALEHRFLARGRSLLFLLLSPVVKLLTNIPFVTPNVVSASQVVLAVGIVAVVPTRPRLAFVIFAATLLIDGLDGALARHTDRATPFGSLFDQFCDHARETIVIAILAWAGALSPFWAAIYPFVYAAFNLTLYLCNRYGTPLPLAIKSYLVVYPAIFAYLWFGHNWLDGAVILSITLMGAVMVQGLAKLHGTLGEQIA